MDKKGADDVSSEVAAARAKLAAKFAGSRLGGKGSMRRKKKVTHRAAATDDKRLQQTLRRLAVSTIPSIEEVNLFRKDGQVVHFDNPRVQANIQANTYVVSGPHSVKPLSELLPGILPQLGQDNLMNLKAIASQMGASAAAAGGSDDLPGDVGSFEDVSNAAAADGDAGDDSDDEPPSLE